MRGGISTTYGAGTPEFEELRLLIEGGASSACEDGNVDEDEFEGSRGCDIEADGGLEGGELLGGSPRVGPVL